MAATGNLSFFNVTNYDSSGAYYPNDGDGGKSTAINFTEDYTAGGLASVTGYNKPWALLKQPTHMVVLLTLAYVIVLILGVVNNSLVVSVIYRNLQLRTVTNYFIANLAVADIFVCILVLPITLLTNILNGKSYVDFPPHCLYKNPIYELKQTLSCYM